MTLSVRCPKCKAVHRVGDEMAGKRAKCRCGAVLIVPAAQQAPAQPRSESAPTEVQQGSIVVRCPGCGKRHKAKASMAGTSARCPCGTVMQIPTPQQPAVAAPVQSTIWDELNDDQWAAIEGRKTSAELAHEQEEEEAADAALHSDAASSGLWRSGKKLVCSSNARFPGRCVKTNQPTDNRVPMKLNYCPPWAYILFGALIAMFLTRKMQAEVGMEQRWVTRRMIHALVGLGVALLGGLCIGIGIATSGQGDVGPVGAVFLLLGMFFSIGGIFYSLLGGRAITVAYIDDMKQHAWLKGAHPDFLASLPQWGGPSH